MSEVMNVLGDECRGDECRTIHQPGLGAGGAPLGQFGPVGRMLKVGILGQETLQPLELLRAGQIGVGGHILLIPIPLIEGLVKVKPSIRWFITPVMLVPHLDEPPLTFSKS